ncbi:MAG: cyclic nucleotide-binding domain-containing protein [Candidatus Dadabacteria bacterium]|nr:MAG: cyclic nucleotide-binding domain-containing protein [Candidatus Dadabacteria bacterium]
MTARERSVSDVRRDILGIVAQGDLRRALRLCLTALRQLPSEPQLWLTLGDVCRQSDQPDRAIRAWERSAELFAARGALIQAISANKLIVELDPAHARTQEQLASLYGRARATSEPAGRPSFDAVEVDLDDLLAEHSIEAAEIIEDETPPATEAGGAAAAPAEPTLIFLDEAPPPPALEILDDEETGIGDAEAELVDDMLETTSGWKDPGSDQGELLIDLPDVPIFSELPPNAFIEVVDQVRRARYFPGEDIVTEGDRGDSFYVIAQGAAEVVKRGVDGEVALAVLGPGTFFGEIAFLTGSERTATVRAADHCDILEFSRGAMETLMARFPSLRDVLERFCRERLIDTVVKTAPLLSTLPARKRAAIVRHFRALEFSDGDQVISPGSISRAVYVIVFGGVRVGVDELGPCAAFGASSLVKQEPELEAHVATGRTLVLEISDDVARTLAERLPEFRRELEALVEQGY